MNRNDDIERVLEQWFTEGPRHMPDRLFDGTLERIERLPRGRLADLQSRLPAMNLNVRLAAAAALIVVLAGASFVLSRAPDVGTSPSPTPAALADAIQAQWTSVGDRPCFGISECHSPYSILVDATTLHVGEFKGDIVSTWSLGPAGELLVSAPQSLVVNKGWHECGYGAEGSYRVSVSPDAATLTLTLANDSCQNRAGILPGEWTRSECTWGWLLCFPERHAGPAPHVASVFRPFGPASSARFAYTIAASILAESDANIQFGNPYAPEGMGILVVAQATLDASGCGDDPGQAEMTPTGIAAWLASFPTLVVTTPVPIRIGGLSGVMVDVSRNTDITVLCGTNFGVWTIGSALMKVHADDKIRVILLERPDDVTLVITSTGRGFPDWHPVTDAMPIIEGFEFQP
ncbi:MAG TPA: hypothetical protein VIF63_10015 [Candidatus Limnocylindrales bacterium]|jgi:hypothetical protein